ALGYTGNIVRCLRALNPDGSNPGLTLMLQDAHLIRRARDLQRLVSCLEWAAEDSGSMVRAMLLCNKVARWNPQSSAFELEWKSTWWRWAESEGGDGRLKKADVWHFTRRTLTAVKEEIAIPLLERASA
ncbi:MAG: hypothetical protein L6R28_25905, partial [Planctomycetes bacterium]|nr:hypothetical protein [Planctomycetota bacterium]